MANNNNMATCLSGSSSFAMYFVLYVFIVCGQSLRECQSELIFTSPQIAYRNEYEIPVFSSDSDYRKLKDGVLGGRCVNDGNILR